ncbi:hypothetical protein XELAEV_18025709mg [Xenopus laevis]|uniref:Nucleolar protein 12 n=1 Tax=Xenopus laevis TaxID=8355 RepID=A0A974D2U0_XENLA|nr:hypothetical protein XELAEV_18025709mg [Xenopus laevis]
MGKKKQKKGQGSRLEVIFDEEKRREYLTGFHKRKMQRRKTAVEEIKRKIKEEQKKMKEERHKEYMKMLKEREEALCELEENDELEEMVTSKTESVRYDHPNHTVTVTTISDLDLSGIRVPPLGNAERRWRKKMKRGQMRKSPKLQYPFPKSLEIHFYPKRFAPSLQAYMLVVSASLENVPHGLMRTRNKQRVKCQDVPARLRGENKLGKPEDAETKVLYCAYLCVFMVCCYGRSTPTYTLT